MRKDRLHWKPLAGFVMAVVVLVAAFYVGSQFFSGFPWQTGVKKMRTENSVRGMFCWDYNDITGDKQEDTLGILEKMGITEFYQDISEELPVEDEGEFLQKAHRKGILVYALFGEASWAVTEQDKMMEKLEWFVDRNNKGKEKWDGVLLDVEPYLTEEWEKDSDAVMEGYVAALYEAKKLLSKQGLSLLLCIPYFYDELGYKSHLEKLIAECSDGIAVMNYNKTNEAEQIRLEALLADKYSKPCISVYELQEPGQHGLQNVNTYYQEGLEGVEESYKRLKAIYPYNNFGMAYHYLKVVKEMMIIA